MNLSEAGNLFKFATKMKQEVLPQYLTVMQKYFPEKLLDPKYRFIQERVRAGKSIAEASDLWERLKDFGTFNYDYTNPTDCSWYDLFTYEMLHGKNKIPEVEIIQKFCNIQRAIKVAKDVIENPVTSLYVDSPEKCFKNETIIITDPCYLIPDSNSDDWEKCDCGQKMSNLNISAISKSTLYGDWSCTTINTSNNETLGHFCADSGMVCVCSLNQVSLYNPEILDWCKAHDWCATIIPDFTGKVKIRIGINDINANYFEPYCYVRGKGNINFKTVQTGL